uniref:BTB domain-containing protein n=1 Tax=Haematobia irritans TaxID=7368 RepID=A0A1L8ECG3_HAEIR
MTDPTKTSTNPPVDESLKELRLPTKIEEMLKVGFMVDCKFIVGPNPETAETILGHKWMFAIQSPVFERMFCGDFLEAKNTTEIRLPDDDPKAFRNLRLLLYNIKDARVDALNLEDTVSLYKLCDKYNYESIWKLCSDHLKSFIEEISDGQLITLFAVVNEIQNSQLLYAVKQQLLSKMYPVIPDLKELNSKHFMDYLDLHIEANLEETDNLVLFNTIDGYLTHHDLVPPEILEITGSVEYCKKFYGQERVTLITAERKPELLERLLSKIDFAKITIENFLAGPGVSKLLTWQQKYFILSQLCSGEPKPTTIKLFENVVEDQIQDDA